MQNIAIRKAQELSTEARQAVEHVLGRRLHGDEEISIMALSPHEAPTGDTRQAAANRLEQRVRKTARRVQSIPGDQIEEVINEAVDHVRSQSR